MRAASGRRRTCQRSPGAAAEPALEKASAALDKQRYESEDVVSNLEATRNFNNNYFQYICRFFPTFCLSHGLQWLSFCSGDTCLLYSDGVFGQASPFDPDIVGLDLAYLGGCAIGYFCLAMFIEYALTFPWIVSYFGSSKAAGPSLKPHQLPSNAVVVSRSDVQNIKQRSIIRTQLEISREAEQKDAEAAKARMRRAGKQRRKG